MRDPYLYLDVDVLKNKLGIKDNEILAQVEAETSRTNMMILYNKGFNDFSPKGVRKIHKYLFEDIYEWAGEYRSINLEKREKLLVGKSVLYSYDVNIEKDLETAFNRINKINWSKLGKREFAINVAHTFPTIWQVHPFREGNTRTVVAFMTLFIESYGYYVNKQILDECSGYIRNAFVLCCFDVNSEYQHLENILIDAIDKVPALYNLDGRASDSINNYEKYKAVKYEPIPHNYIE